MKMKILNSIFKSVISSITEIILVILWCVPGMIAVFTWMFLVNFF